MKAWDYAALLRQAAEERGIHSKAPFYIFDCLDAEPDWWTWPGDFYGECDDFCRECAERCIEHAKQILGLPVEDVFNTYGDELYPRSSAGYESDATGPCPMCGVYLDRAMTNYCFDEESEHFLDPRTTLDDHDLPYITKLCDFFSCVPDDPEDRERYDASIRVAERACRELNVSLEAQRTCQDGG